MNVEIKNVKQLKSNERVHRDLSKKLSKPLRVLRVLRGLFTTSFRHDRNKERVHRVTTNSLFAVFRVLCGLVFLLSFSPTFAEELKIDTGTLTAPNFRIPGEIQVVGILDFEENWGRKVLGNDFHSKLELKFYIGDRTFGQVKLEPTTVEQEIKWAVKLSPKDLPLDAPQKIAQKKYKLEVLFNGRKIMQVP